MKTLIPILALLVLPTAAQARALVDFDPQIIPRWVESIVVKPHAQDIPAGMDPAPEGLTFPVDVLEGGGTELSRKMIPEIVADGDPVRYRVGHIAKFRIKNCIDNVGLIRWHAGHDYRDPPKVLDTNGNCNMRFRFLSPGDQEIRASYQLWTEDGTRITTEQNARTLPVEVADRRWYEKRWAQVAVGALVVGGAEVALRRQGKSLFAWGR